MFPDERSSLLPPSTTTPHIHLVPPRSPDRHSSQSSSTSINDLTSDSDDEDRLTIHQLIHRIRLDLLTLIDTPLSTEQLTSPAITFSITRPLEQTYLLLHNEAIIFALLVNRVQFITDSTHALTLHSVNATRATLCEILATNLLRRVHESDLIKHNERLQHVTGTLKSTTRTVNQKLTPEEEEACLLKSANVLATAFSLFQGAPIEVIRSLESDWGTREAKNVLSRQSNALEMAIVSEAKQFIRSPACQRVIEAIWNGKIVYTSTAIVDIVSDRYKRRPVSLYNPRNAPILNHYRLGVPRNRTVLEYVIYSILIFSYVLTLQTRELERMNNFEIWYNIFTLGFAVDKLGSIFEHGWLVFIANLWNGFDAGFILGHFLYFSLRLSGLFYLRHYDLKSHWLNEQSHQVLSCLAILVFPRIAFITLSDHILILSLRSMLSDFVFLMLLGAWCFMGFLYSLYCLQLGKSEAGDQIGEPYSVGQIAQWMLFIFFGLDSTGISKAPEFHQVLGPIIFIIYACLSNTLLVTVLVSILSKSFSDISNDAIAETLYRKAVLTFEGVKSDALFSFQPPFNIPAMLILMSLKPFLTPRRFHTVVVFLCRFFGCPVLLTISFFERYVIGPFDKQSHDMKSSLKLSVVNSLGGLGMTGLLHVSRRKTNKVSQVSSRISRNLRKFGGLDVINACFDYEPDPPIHNEEEAQEQYERTALRRRFGMGIKRKSEETSATLRASEESKNRSIDETRLESGPSKSSDRPTGSKPDTSKAERRPLSSLQQLFQPQKPFISSLLVPPLAATIGIMKMKSAEEVAAEAEEEHKKKTRAKKKKESLRKMCSKQTLRAHKPASIIQDEMMEDRRLMNTSNSSTSSSSSSIHLDELDLHSISKEEHLQLKKYLDKKMKVESERVEEVIERLDRLEKILLDFVTGFEKK